MKLKTSRGMSFDEALAKLGIEKYRERIFNSNSHGELFHLYDYITIASSLPEAGLILFPIWFDKVVKYAEDNWERPESVFQHILKILEGNV